MTLDELLKQNAAWLEQAMKRPVFGKVDDQAVKFPEEQRKRRMAELKARIEALSRRKEEVATAYDRAIESEKNELKALSAQGPVGVPQEIPPRKPRKPRKPKK